MHVVEMVDARVMVLVSHGKMPGNFFNKILFPEYDRIPRRPIALWLAILEKEFLKILTLQEKDNDFSWLESLEKIINNLSLICFYTGHSDSAEKLCYKGHALFSYIYNNQIYSPQKEWGILQPWINLIRLDRFMSRYDKAMEKLKVLSPRNKILFLGEVEIVYDTLSLSSRNLVFNCFYEETIKLLLQMESYEELLMLIEQMDHSGIPEIRIMFLLEARLIALYHIEGTSKANIFFKLLNKSTTKEFKIIFFLKYIHFTILENNINFSQAQIKKLVSYQDNLKGTSLGILRIWLKVAQTCKILNLDQESQKLSFLLIEEFKNAEDELSHLESLVLLKEDKKFSNEWDNILKNTDYIRFRKIFIRDSPSKVNNALPLVKEVINFLNEKETTYVQNIKLYRSRSNPRTRTPENTFI